MKAGCRAAGTAAITIVLFFAAAAGASAVDAPVAGTPAVTGTAAVGSTVTCEEGTWTGDPVFTYQWLRDGADIAGQTGRTHGVVAADADHDIACHVTGTNDGGSDEATSAEVHVPAVAPQSTSATTIAGTPAVGPTLTCTAGSFSGAPAPAVAIAWLRDGQVVAGYSGTSYNVAAADAGHAIACRATGANSGGTASSASQALNVPLGAPGAGTPAVTGTAAVGQTVTCSEGTWTGDPAFTYAWLRDGVAIPGAAGRTYAIAAADAAFGLACRVGGANAGGSAEATSAAVAVPAVAAVPSQSPAIRGTSATGATLTCTGVAFSGLPAPATSIAWLRDGVPIAGATGATYNVANADVGHALACRVTATNAGGSATATSAAVDVPKPLEGATPGEVATAFGLPRARRCLTRRAFVLRLRAPAGIRVERMRVFVDDERVTARKRDGRYGVRLDLPEIHAGSFVVEIRVVTRDGRTLIGRRTYRICPQHRHGGKQRTDGGES